jgi:hypothetical protein
MMMAQDSTPDRPGLSKASVDALKSALEKFLADETDTATLQPALQRISTEARQKKIYPEQLLVLLKDVWYGLPQLRQMPEGERQHRMLQRVVTMCIREYYSAPGSNR